MHSTRSWVFALDSAAGTYKNFTKSQTNQRLGYISNKLNCNANTSNMAAFNALTSLQRCRNFSTTSNAFALSTSTKSSFNRSPSSRSAYLNHNKIVNISSSPLLKISNPKFGVLQNANIQKAFYSSKSESKNSGPSFAQRVSSGVSFLFYATVVVGGIGLFVSFKKKRKHKKLKNMSLNSNSETFFF